MIDWRKTLICICLFSIPFLFNLPSLVSEETDTFHSDVELEEFRQLLDSITFIGDYNGLFASSASCQQCHGYDTAMIASVDLAGNDINLFDDWQATMMANSAKDPFWRAKVSHEVLLYPEHQAKIETKCTSCHAPLGHFEALHAGAEFYSMAEALVDTFALDGVSCLACHQQSTENLGFTHSGELHFDTAKVAYGPFISPLSSPMLNATLYEPVYSEHISDAGICAGCHTLITQTFDFDGNILDNDFVEQATYHEWLNSKYNTEDISCQKCHMPALEKGMFILVAGFDTEPRSPFYLHELVGANTTMLKLMKENAEALGIKATAEAFDETIAATEKMLRNKTLDLNIISTDRDADTAYFEVLVENKAGHKFPSGYPARRAFIEFKVTDDEGNTLFISGKQDDTYEVEGQNPTYEPHYDVITSEDEVQIYELVIGDVNGDVTTVLERGAFAIKDNRLVPEGFSSTHYTYDTTKVAGLALNDDNFNKDDAGQEGTGSDKIAYHIPLSGYDGLLTATAKIYYQATPPKWMKEMFEDSTPEIEVFRTMFNEADREPFFIKETSVELGSFVHTENLNTTTASFVKLQIEANGQINIYSTEKHDASIYSLDGKLIKTYTDRQEEYTITLRTKGIYIIRFTKSDGTIQTEKVLVY